MPLEVFPVKNLVRSDNKFEIFTPGKLIIEKPVDLILTVPMQTSYSYE